MEEHLKTALRELGFREDEMRFDREPGGRVVGGVLVSERFEGKSQQDRQNELWAALEGKLPAEELRQIVAIFTMTPLEIAD